MRRSSTRIVQGQARCEHCRKPLRAGRVIAGSDGVQFDSVTCRNEYQSAAEFKALANRMRVARSRLKTVTIVRAEALYRRLGGQDWSRVERFLRALL